MDITQITDVEKLESLCYKEIKQLHITQNNIQMLEQRIVELNASQSLEESQ